MRKLAVLILLLLVSTAPAQQPQADEPSPEPIVNGNYQLVNGVGPGYWVYQTAAGLSIAVGPGTAPACLGGPVYYAGGTFTLTNNATNYVYLKLDSSCAVTLDTTGPTNRDITVAQIVTSGGVVTSWNDLRSWSSSRTTFGGMNHQTGTSYTIVATDRAKDVTLNNSSAVAVTLPTTFDASFAFASQNLGTGTVTFTPSSGTINGSATLTMATNTGGWLFWDGTNWYAVLGSSGGGGGSTTTIHTYQFPTGDPYVTSPFLNVGNDAPSIISNDFGADETVIAVAALACSEQTCTSSIGSITTNVQLTGGTTTSILSSAITVTSPGTWVAGTVSGSPVIHSFSSSGASCPTTPCTADEHITATSGGTRYMMVKVDVVGPGGTGSTTVGTGGASNNQLLYDCAGLVCGITNGTAGQPLTSTGTGSVPTFHGCLLSNGVNAQTANYTLLTADDGSLITMNGSSITATLPNPPPSSTWCATIENLNSTTLTVSRNSLNINGAAANLTLFQNQTTTIWTDGSNYFAGTASSGCSLSNGVNAQTGSYTLLSADNGKLITENGSSLTATLPNPPPTSTWCATVENLNSSALTLSRNSLTINGGTSNLSIAQNQSAQIWTDGSNYFATLSANPATATAGGLSSILLCADTSGSGTAQSCTTSPSFTVQTNDCVNYTTTTANTGTSLTVNVNSLGATSVAKWQNSTTLAANDIRANTNVRMCYDGSNWEISPIGNAPSGGGGGCSTGTNNSGMCLLEEHTASSSSELDFTSCISSTYDNYAIEYESIIPATSAAGLRLQVHSGSSYDSGSNYQWGWGLWYSGATGSLFATGSNSDTSVLVSTQPPSTTTYGSSGTVKMYSVNSTSKKKLFVLSGSGEDNNHTGNLESLFGGGVYTQSANAVNGFRVLESSGNITSGTVRCYGINQ